MAHNPRVITNFGLVFIFRCLWTAIAPLLKGLLGIALLAVAPTTVRAVPSFARQMDEQCIMCHSEFPVLNDMGRLFKLSGYTMSTGQTSLPPLAVMLEP